MDVDISFAVAELDGGTFFNSLVVDALADCGVANENLAIHRFGANCILEQAIGV